MFCKLFFLNEERMKEYYSILGINPTHDINEVKKAYREKAKLLHPDKNSTPTAKEQFQELAEAYETLSDPNKLKQYEDSIILADAIRNNEHQKIIVYHPTAKLHIHHLCIALSSPSTLDSQTYVLLKYVLPEGISMEMLDIYLAMRGCPSHTNFPMIPSMHLTGCPGLPSPIQLASESGIVSMVKYLVQFVNERPIFIFKNDYDGKYFIKPGADDIVRFKVDIGERCKRIASRAEILELFLKNPTVDLEKQINSLKELTYHPMLDFFAWAAFYNKADLFENKYFRLLILTIPDALKTALHVAAAFNCKEFILNNHIPIAREMMKEILSILVANSHDELLQKLMARLKAALDAVSYQSFVAHLRQARLKDSEPLPFFDPSKKLTPEMQAEVQRVMQNIKQYEWVNALEPHLLKEIEDNLTVVCLKQCVSSNDLRQVSIFTIRDVFQTKYGKIALEERLFTLQEVNEIQTTTFNQFMSEKGIQLLRNIKDTISITQLADPNMDRDLLKKAIEQGHIAEEDVPKKKIEKTPQRQTFYHAS